MLGLNAFSRALGMFLLHTQNLAGNLVFIGAEAQHNVGMAAVVVEGFLRCIYN